MNTPHLRLVVDHPSPSNVDALWERYRVDFNRWHKTKAEPDNLAARASFNAWAIADLGPHDSAQVLIQLAQPWGFN